MMQRLRSGLKRLGMLGAAAVLAACAVQPTVPAWRLEARNAVERATAAALEGNDRVATHQWQQAWQAASAAAQAEALARVALARCAVAIASLQARGCAAAQPWLEQASPAERAYAAYLQGQPLPNAAALPPAHRRIAERLQADGLPLPQRRGALQDIPDPLARLLAGALLWQHGGLDEAAVDLLVDTASEQGWRPPLAAWLAVRQQQALAAQDLVVAERVRQRLQWLLEPGRPGGE
jgi:hypothetical protein